MNSAGHSNNSSIFQHGLQDGYLSLNPHVKGGLFPLTMGGASLAKLVGQTVILADGFSASMVQISRFNVGKLRNLIARYSSGSP